MITDPNHPNTTKISPSIWKVDSFDGLLTELAAIEDFGKKSNSLIVFRGQRDKKWLLDSTFVRSFKTTLFGIKAHDRLTTRITETKELHLSILNLYLLKFGVLCRPSDELEEKSAELDLDAWFEFMKRIQQYPNQDGFFLKGTNLIDWSLSSDVALYFANEDRDSDGALFICDATATGNTHQKEPFGKILELMDEKGNNGSQLGVPLLIQPPKHISNPRPNNQQAIYFAQMDMRYDLELIWNQYSKIKGSSPVVLKIELPLSLMPEIASHLSGKGMDKQFIYPDES
tara:strand:+ start:111 stop:968 length:858 start_codon:yes stop_codon:yes gene_type:complete